MELLDDGLADAFTSSVLAPNARREWEINIIVSPADVPGSVRILFFLGSDPKPVARAGIFADDNRNVAGDRVFNFAVPLTSALLDQNVALRAEDTVPKLTEQLRWRIERVNTPISHSVFHPPPGYDVSVRLRLIEAPLTNINELSRRIMALKFGHLRFHLS